MCFALPKVPSSSIITLLVILNGVNLNYLNIGLLYTIDWFLDRVRSTGNVYGICFGTVMLDAVIRLDNKINDDKVDDFELNEAHELTEAV